MAQAIGVIVPNFNYARYLGERIGTIAAQTRTPAALAFLDDASTDNSWSLAPGLLASLACEVSVRRSPSRVGRVLRQWRTGLAQLDTPLIWIAEADDRAAPGFLAALAERLEADPAAQFAFCDSAPIDADGVRLAEDSKPYYAATGETALAQDAQFTTEDFLRRCLCPRNLVLNASAVLWRAPALLGALDRIGADADHWHCAADWLAYAEACAVPGTIHYVATPLNEHRRHATSVTGATPPAQHYAEIVMMLLRLRDRLGADAARDAAMRRHLAELRRAWSLVPHAAAA